MSRTTQGGNQLKISLLPCGPDLRVVEREIIYSLNARRFNMRGIEGQTWKLFEQEFQPLGKTYDYVIFDCPPGISPLSEVAIRASDLVIVPTIPDFISVYGINGLLRVFWGATRGELPPPKLKPHVLVTMFQRSFKQHKLKVEELERAANTEIRRILLLKTKVQHAAALAGAMRNIDEAPTLNQKTFIQKYGGDVTEVLYQLVQASFMPSDIDGIAVLRAIALAPKLFPDAAAEINNFARKYVAGQLKPATMSSNG